MQKERGQKLKSFNGEPVKHNSNYAHRSCYFCKKKKNDGYCREDPRLKKLGEGEGWYKVVKREER